jgi:hypothetical protein
MTPSRTPVLAFPLLAVAIALFAEPAAAQQGKGKLEAGVAWGRSFGGSFAKGSNEYFDEKVQADTDILAGVRLGYLLSDRWAVEILAERVNTRFVASSDGVFSSREELGTLQMRFIEGGLRYALLRGRFVPVVGFGAGLAVLDPDIPARPDVRDSNRFTIHCDAGFKAYALPWLGVRLDVRARAAYLGTRRLGEDSGLLDTGRWFRHFDGDASLFFAF